MLPLKIKDEVILKDRVCAIIIPEEYKGEFENIIPADLSDRVHYIPNDCKDIWEWSEKVYEFVKQINENT